MFSWLREKLNPAQSEIFRDTGDTVSSETYDLAVTTAYNTLESVNRGSNLVINACSGLDYDIKEAIGPIKVRAKVLNKLLNYTPNLYQSANDFRINIFTDFIFTGQVFIYFDGAHLHHLPSDKVQIKTDEKTFIRGYTYNESIEFKEDEIISFKDVNSDSVYRGASRLNSAKNSMNTLASMAALQQNFFDSGATFGMVLTTENTLSIKAKEKTIAYFLQKYNPKKGAKRPIILDSGLKPQAIAQNTFKDMDFDVAIKTHGDRILTALGVPPILLAGGNNANISPNLRLFYLETILPIVRAYTSALERYFGYDIEPIVANVSALQPDLKELGGFITGLVNTGVITPNEARAKLRYPTIPGGDNDELRVPANIAGSAANPSEGGAPPKDTANEE